MILQIQNTVSFALEFIFFQLYNLFKNFIQPLAKSSPRIPLVLLEKICLCWQKRNILGLKRQYWPYWRMHDIETYNQEAKLVIMLNVFIHEFHEICSGHAARLIINSLSRSSISIALTFSLYFVRRFCSFN